MTESADAILDWLLRIPDSLLYLVVGAAAAIENIIPPIPADVIVIAGAVVAGAGEMNAGLLFLCVWFGNVGSALAIYWLGREYGEAFFATRIGRALLAPQQIEALANAYHRWGITIVFFSRFLPVFRPVVPVFAGLARLGFWKTAFPLAAASGLWYGLLVYLGNAAGENWQEVLAFVARFGGWMWLAAGVALVLLGLWWWRTRRPATGTGRP